VNIVEENELTEFRVRNAEKFLEENSALVAIIGTKINIRKLPEKFLDCLLNGVEACQYGCKTNTENIKRKHIVH
jgi:hypothetical protein